MDPIISENENNKIILTKLQPLRTASMIPAVNAEQFSVPLSLGTDMNLLTSGSFSMI